MIQQIRARRVLTEYGWRENQAVTVSDGIITAITPLAAKKHSLMQSSSAWLTLIPMSTADRVWM